MADVAGTAVEAAQALLAQHLQPVPIPARSKGIKEKGWTKKEYTVDDFRPDMNIGIRHDNVVCVDRDTPESYAMRRAFLPSTRMDGKESTPEAHAWYFVEGGTQPRFREYHDAGGEVTVELRSGRGHQTLVPPSVHPETGERYVIGNDAPIATIAADRLERGVRYEAAATAIARAYPPPGGQYHFGLYLAGFLCKELGLDGQVAAEIMVEAYKAAGYEPDRDAYKNIESVVQSTVDKLAAGEGEEVAGRVRLEAGYGDKLTTVLKQILAPRESEITLKGNKLGEQIGTFSVSAHLQDKGAGDTGPTTNHNPIRVGWWLDKESMAPNARSFGGHEYPPPMEWIARGVIPKNHASTWYGMGGVAKSLLSMHFGMHVASDKFDEWLGFPVVTVPVLYADWELEWNTQLLRAFQLAKGLGLDDPPSEMYYENYTATPLEAARDSIAQNVENLGIGLVIVDSIGFAMGGDANEAQTVLDFQRNIINPLREQGVTFLQLDHQAKMVKGENYGDKGEYGSVYKQNSTRSSFQLKREDPQDAEFTGHVDPAHTTYISMRHQKANFSQRLDPFTLKIRFDNEHGPERDNIQIALEDTPLRTPEPSQADQIYAALREQSPQTAAQLAAGLGLGEQTVRNRLNDALRGRVVKDDSVKPTLWYAKGNEPRNDEAQAPKKQKPTSAGGRLIEDADELAEFLRDE